METSTESIDVGSGSAGVGGVEQPTQAATGHPCAKHGPTTPLLSDAPGTLVPSDSIPAYVQTTTANTGNTGIDGHSSAEQDSTRGSSGGCETPGGSTSSCGCGPSCPAVAALRRELAERDEMVESLQAQVQRLASFVDGALNSESGASAAGMQVSALQLKLLERSSELSRCQDALSIAHQQLQAASEGQALAQRQAAAMKLLLADHLREEGTLLRGLLLQQEQLEELRGQVAAEQAATAAAQKELAKKSDQCDCLQAVVLAANQQVSELQAAAPHALTDHQQLEVTKQQLAAAQEALDDEQERAAAAERVVADLRRQLAVNADMLQHFTRRATTLEQQVRGLEAKCEDLEAAVAAAGDGETAPGPSSAPSSSGGALPAATGNSPSATEAPSGMGAFARMQALMAPREADQASRLKEELREKDKLVKELQAAVKQSENQVHGLQTVMVTKNAANHRLEAELRQVEAKLKQQTATAAADTAALQGALEEAFTAAEDLHQQLAAAEDREAALSKEVLAVRGQLQDVLEALLADADTLRRQQPEQYASLQAELPALATELGLAAQEEGRSGSPEAGDKQLLLGPVLPGLVKKSPGGLANLGRFFNKRQSSTSTGTDGISSPWAMGSRKGRDSFTGNPNNLAVAARASLEWLQQRPPPGHRTSMDRERSATVDTPTAAGAAAHSAAWSDLNVSRVSSSTLDAPCAAVVAAAAAAVSANAAADGGSAEELAAAKANGSCLPPAASGSPPLDRPAVTPAATVDSGGVSPGQLSIPAAGAGTGAAAAGRLPRSVQQRLDAVKALVTKMSAGASGYSSSIGVVAASGGSVTKDSSPLGHIAAGSKA